MSDSTPRRSCHWAHIAGPIGSRRSGMSKVWICEYPYPTMREDGPSEECDGCPIWEEQQREARAAESRSQSGTPMLHLVRPVAAR